MRRAAKVDSNQPEIVEYLRSLGCSVWHTHQLGKGFPDIAVGFGGVTMLAELKDGSKPISAQKLTPDEEKFRITWKGCVYLIRSEEDAKNMVNTMKRWMMHRIKSEHEEYMNNCNKS